MVAVGLAVSSLVVASAASLGGVRDGGLAAGMTALLSCDGDGVTASYAVTSGTVESVTISGLDAACAGGVLRATLTDATGASIGAGGPVAVSGTSATATLSPAPQASAVTAAHVSVEGPS